MSLFRKKQKELPPPTEPLEFSVAGMSYLTDNIIKIGTEVALYNASDDVIIENCSDHVYQFSFDNKIMSFMSEPKNKADKKAIMVLLDNIKIGYVPADLTATFRHYTKYPCNVTYNFRGGHYKNVEWVHDKKKDVIKYKVTKDFYPYYCNVVIIPVF